MRSLRLRSHAIGLCMLNACVADPPPTATLEQLAVSCGYGPTVRGIDLSYWDDSVDWPRARAAGIDFAFIRVSDGLQYIDPEFAGYWTGARAAGVIRGAYQFFRPAQDPIAQADLLLARAPYEPGDLPPVIDVETDSDLSDDQVTAAVRTWVDYVRATIGREPIVYAGLYSWPRLTGGADLTTSPLWIAQYTSAACPDIPAPWTSWLFWQHSNTGQVDGVESGELDVNVFNGTYDQLRAFADTGEPPCPAIGPGGAELDERGPCFTPGGPAEYMRRAGDAGAGGALYWTRTTRAADEVTNGRWALRFAAAGTYRVEVHTAASYATSRAARYAIRAAGVEHEVVIDQTAVDGWQSLGEFAFAADDPQWVHLGDNTGEPAAAQLVFDAIRVIPIEPEPEPEPVPAPTMEGGCTTSSPGTGWLALAGLFVFARARVRNRAT